MARVIRNGVMALKRRINPDRRVYRTEVRRNLSNDEIRKMIEWAELPEHAGLFSHYFDHKIDGMVFNFTNEDVAFHFRMRWA